MNGWEIRRYRPEDAKTWDEFVRNSRNGTFLFLRGYMDYHADRFRDSSRMAWLNGKLRALLPANITDDGVLHSHQGLSYGGWVFPKNHVDGSDILALFECFVEQMRGEGIVAFDYKAMPEIYCSRGSADDRYALFRLGAEMTGCGLSEAVDLTRPIAFSEMQRRHLKGALKVNAEISEEKDLAPFMTLLENCLRERHDVSPVHTLEEMELLRSRFPQNIRVYCVRVEDRRTGETGENMERELPSSSDAGEVIFPDAGVCVYDTGRVAHAQYIATTERGRELNLLTLLFHWLMTQKYADRRWFDFGISTEDNGHYLNSGLLRQKFSYGSGSLLYPRYLLRIDN